MNNTGYFRGGAVFKDDRVYALSRSVTTYQDSREDEISYSISEYVVTAVGRLYLTAKPASGGKPVKFEPLPDVSPAKGIWLEEVGAKSAWPLHLFGNLESAKRYQSIQEKSDARRKARARR